MRFFARHCVGAGIVGGRTVRRRSLWLKKVRTSPMIPMTTCSDPAMIMSDGAVRNWSSAYGPYDSMDRTV